MAKKCSDCPDSYGCAVIWYPQNLNRKHVARRGKQAVPFGDRQDIFNQVFFYKFSGVKGGWVSDAMPGAKAIGRDDLKCLSLMTSTGTRRSGEAYVGQYRCDGI